MMVTFSARKHDAINKDCSLDAPRFIQIGDLSHRRGSRFVLNQTYGGISRVGVVEYRPHRAEAGRNRRKARPSAPSATTPIVAFVLEAFARCLDVAQAANTAKKKHENLIGGPRRHRVVRNLMMICVFW